MGDVTRDSGHIRALKGEPFTCPQDSLVSSSRGSWEISFMKMRSGTWAGNMEVVTDVLILKSMMCLLSDQRVLATAFS